MKSVEFGEDRLKDLSSVASALFEEEKDPRSWGYRRQLIRPPVCWWKVLLGALLPLGAAMVLYVGMKKAELPTLAAAAVITVLLVLWMVLRARAAVLKLIGIYQHCAPAWVRERCRFEPSCSVYMQLCIQRYGLLKGMWRGINRLKRCNVRGGGIDWPTE